MIVYKATNQINGKSYIGQTTEKLSRRKGRHFALAFNRNGNMVFCRALRKYGKNNFSWCILFEQKEIDMKLLNLKEIELIKKHGTFDNGYNSTEGGLGHLGRKMSPEQIEK